MESRVTISSTCPIPVPVSSRSVYRRVAHWSSSNGTHAKSTCQAAPGCDADTNSRTALSFKTCWLVTSTSVSFRVFVKPRRGTE